MFATNTSIVTFAAENHFSSSDVVILYSSCLVSPLILSSI